MHRLLAHDPVVTSRPASSPSRRTRWIVGRPSRRATGVFVRPARQSRVNGPVLNSTCPLCFGGFPHDRHGIGGRPLQIGSLTIRVIARARRAGPAHRRTRSEALGPRVERLACDTPSMAPEQPGDVATDCFSPRHHRCRPSGPPAHRIDEAASSSTPTRSMLMPVEAVKRPDPGPG